MHRKQAKQNIIAKCLRFRRKLKLKSFKKHSYFFNKGWVLKLNEVDLNRKSHFKICFILKTY